MGWTGMKAKYYYKNGMINRKKECDELIEACPDDYKLIKSALIGTCYYAAVRMLKKNRAAGRWHCNQNNCPNEGRPEFSVQMGIRRYGAGRYLLSG